jgi:hypothetical protein
MNHTTKMAFGKVSDLLVTEREGMLKVDVALADLLDGSVELVVGNVVPGEPIRVRWRVVLGLRGTDSTSFSIQLLINDQPVHERMGITAAQATVGSIAAVGTWGDQNFQAETIVIGDPNVARIVYRFGTKKLSAEVRGQGGTAPEFVGSVRFRVVPEPLDSSWWEWRVPAFESIEWKTGYALVGDFVNRSRFASIALLSAELSEVRSEENPQINPCDYLPVQVQSRNLVAAGGRASFSFGLLHDWHWLIPAAYVITGPINKTFTYAVFFHFTDEFGNVYDGQCSARRVRHVGVPKKKRLAAVAAQTAMANAAFWATMFTWPIAAAWYGVAAFNGEIAKDPPAPDLRFREPVDVVPLPLPRWSAEGSTAPFHATTSLLETAAHLAALERARTVRRARMLGARLAGDEAALKQHQDAYLKIEQWMIETSGKLGDILPAVQEEADKEPRLHPENVEPLLRGLAREGLPEAMRRAMSEGEVSLAEINSLSALVRDREIVDLACANGLFLTPFVVSLQRFVQEVQGDREMVLAGETYVHVSGRDHQSSEETVPDVEATLRPSSRRSC